MTAQGNTGQPPWTEWHQHSTSRRHTMAQSLRKPVRKGLIEWDGKAHIAVMVIAFWHLKSL
jgi:hypothetical protein